MKEKYFLSAPHMGQQEMPNIQQAFSDNWIAPLGPFVGQFETESAKMVEKAHAVAMCSGTAAIHVALRLLNVKQSDVVFCSSLTFAGSCNPILYEKAEPVFIDAERQTWGICPDALEKGLKKYQKLGKLPKAVIAVSLFGTNPQWEKIVRLCREYKVALFEDAAESFGASYNGRPAGSFGDFSILSFNGNKIITTSGGGLLLTDNKEHATHALKMITQARDPAPYYLHSELGFNYRMSNICAAIGCGQLKVLNDRVKRKTEIYEYYKLKLNNVKGIGFNPKMPHDKPNHWLTVITFDPKQYGQSRCLQIAERLNKINIEVRPVWKPMHTQPIFKDCDFISTGEDVANSIFEQGLCLPSWTQLGNEDLDYIVQELKHLL